MFKKIVSLMLVIAMCATMCIAMASCADIGTNDGDVIASPLPLKDITASVTVPEDFKIGFIFLHDENSTYDKNFIDAANAAAAALGLTKDQVIMKVDIDEGPECYDAAVELIEEGCDLIFADSFGHEDFMIQAAEEYPEVQFCHATGTKAHTKKLPNFHNAFASIYEGRYIAGIAAGMKLQEMIDAGEFTAEEAKIGYVGAWPYAEVISGYTSWFLGVRSVVPNATMEVRYTNSWYDEPAEKATAEALIANGCSLISQHADSMGAPTACENAGIPNVAYNGTTGKTETFIIASKINWVPYFEYMLDCVINGKDIDTDYTGSLATGSEKWIEIGRAHV